MSQTSMPTKTPWRINVPNKDKIITLEKPLKEHGDPIAYQHADIPDDYDNWNLAKLDPNGKVFFGGDRASRLPGPGLRQLDFTYLTTVVHIPENYTVDEFHVKFDQVDDGARVYIFNSDHPDGTYDEKADLKYQQRKQETTDLSHLIKAGEDNRIVIVQFDDAPGGNHIRGVEVVINGSTVGQPLETVAAGATSTHAEEHTPDRLLDTTDRPAMVNGKYTFWNSKDPGPPSPDRPEEPDEECWVKLKNLSRVTQIKIRWAGGARATEYNVLTSSDGENWRVVDDITISREIGKDEPVVMEPSIDVIDCDFIGQYVKLHMTEAAGTYQYYSCHYIAPFGISL